MRFEAVWKAAVAGLALALLASTGPARSFAALSASKPPIADVPIALMRSVGSVDTMVERETDRRFIPASLTKLMTVYTAFELLDDGTLLPDQSLPVRDETFRTWSGRGSSMFVAQGSNVTVDNLLKAIVTVSANDGCVVLAEGAAGSVENFTHLMNAKARQLGMTDSHFNTPNGWPDEGRTYTSARDLARLAEAMIKRHPDKYRRYFGLPGFRWNNISQNNRNPILGAIEGADGLKTGFTNEAGYGFVGSAERDGRRLILVIGGAESARQRKQIARAFMEWGFRAWKDRRLFGDGEIVTHLPVQGGADLSLPVTSDGGISISDPAGTNSAVRAGIRYRGPIEAPIEKGQVVGDLVVTSAGKVRGTATLVAARTVGRANGWQRLRNGIVGLWR